jgi:hypothetical protein
LLLAALLAVASAASAAPSQAAPLPAWAPIAASGPTNLPPAQSEVQRVAVDAEGGTFKLTFDGKTTAAIVFNATANVLKTRLNALSTVGGAGGSVAVQGGPGDKGATSPYFVTFGGDLAEEDVPQMSADSSALSGGEGHHAAAITVVGGGPGTAEISIYPQNVGGAPSSGTTELEFALPPGILTSEKPHGEFGAHWSCPAGAGETAMKCTTAVVATPGVTLPPLIVPVVGGPGAANGSVHIEVEGGGAATATYDMPLILSAFPAPAGLQSFTAAAYKDSGEIDTRAGAHPYSASTGILVNTVRSPLGFVVPAGEFRDILVDTPPGFFGNPLAAPACPEAFEHKDCEQTSIVATAQVPLGVGQFGEFSSVNNIEAPFGFPAKFRFLTGRNNVIVNVVASLRSDEDYGLEVGSFNTPQLKPVMGAFFTIWGSPFDEGHDEQRCKDFQGFVVPPVGVDCLNTGGEEVAFLSNPVDCAEEALRPPVATINLTTWQNPSLLFAADVALEPVSECDKLKFEAGFGFEPTDTKASDSPAAFRTELSVPTGGLLSPEGLMNPTIRESAVELPTGVVLNAAAADGLAACSKEQIGLLGTGFPRPNEIRFNKNPNSCPDASKIGTGELKSELIAEPLKADLFLAAQGEGNPFGSLFAIYLVIEDPRNGIFVKLPGEVQVNEADGAQRILFRDLPPLPFTYLKLRLKGGSRSPLATPTTCGNYLANATDTPWSAPESGPPTVSSSGFEIDRGPNGQPCAATPADRPFDLDLNAGADSPVAGAFSPLAFQIARPDGAQEIDTLQFALPPGLAASLKGIPYCTEAALAAAADSSGRQEQENPACPSASQIGRTLAGAGSGPTPFYSPGKLYLAPPYKGAPISVAAITPAVAGPFDLGNVLIRTALFVERSSAQVTAKSDPIPQILEGVPLRVRDIRVFLDRPNFALNPTSCETNAIAARVTGNSGAVANLSERFQVAGCEKLRFQPRISLSLKGGTKRGDNPALRAVVRPRRGDANIARASVTLPRSAFLDQGHIRTICTRVQFAADTCPKAAIYGRAEASTPLLDEPLRGPVYLRSSDNELPDLVADLRGPPHQPIRVEAAFRTDSIRGGIRSTIDAAPDAPVTEFVLEMQGGKKGLVVNSQNLCAHVNRANARLKAHNNRRYDFRPKVVARNCAKGRSGKPKGKRAR